MSPTAFFLAADSHGLRTATKAAAEALGPDSGPSSLPLQQHEELHLLTTNEGAMQTDDASLRSLLLDLHDHDGNEAEDCGVGAPNEDSGTLFNPLLGYYEVTRSLPPPGPNNRADRPVGGKWGNLKNPIASLHKSYQHLLPPFRHNTAKGPAAAVVAQVINLVSIRILGGLLWIHVVLRGDATPLTVEERKSLAADRNTPQGLSNRTVRADFDPPRIVLATAGVTTTTAQTLSNNAASTPSTGVPNTFRTLFCASLGPTSSVVLDTPYCRGNVRIGKGSRGSWFVFRRLSPNGVEEEAAVALCDTLTNVKPVRQSVLTGALSMSALLGGVAMTRLPRWTLLGSIPYTIVTALAAIATAWSTGGIQQRRDDRANDTP